MKELNFINEFFLLIKISKKNIKITFWLLTNIGISFLILHK